MNMIISAYFSLALYALSLVIYLSCATDPDPLQDFCIAQDYYYKKQLFVNGEFCKDPNKVRSNEFVCRGETFLSDTGVNATKYDVNSCAAHNTMGVSAGIGRLAPGGYVVTHYHPRGSELVIVKRGKIFTLLRTSNDKYYANVVRAGEAVVLPQGMPHFVANLWRRPANAYAAFSSQNPGTVFTKPITGAISINVDKLAEEFLLDKEIVEMMRKSLASLEN